ncbi:trypsin-like peptidase domain-containing protein [Candidatus Pelagibacter sp.]|uniref:trypsin-like peptidase domain-containing protein n=1 Tax=Candidatus Pelagibacter sp. TaxID=2024849 RepID=UPI003F84D401
MFKKNFFINLFLIFFFQINVILADAFDSKIDKIRAEINRNDLKSAINLLKKINVGNDTQQDKVHILYGDIYLKINQTIKAEEFYEKAFFTTNKYVESLSLVGLAEVKLIQGKIDKSIRLSKQAISINPDLIRPKITLATALTRIGEGQQAIEILQELHNNKKTAAVSLAISDYYISFNDIDAAINILENYLKRNPNHIRVLDQIAGLYLFKGEKEKAIEAKLKVYKFHELNKDKKKILSTKSWILSVDPTYFDEPVVIENIVEKILGYIEKEIENYDEKEVKPDYEDFVFAPTGTGSGFIVGDGKFVITNYHIVQTAKKIAVRNGTGIVSEAKIANYSKEYDLAILKLENPYPKKFAIDSKNFAEPKIGADVISIGYPGIGITFDQPTITQGIISKIFDDETGIMLTTAAINQGNSGGPIFNLEGKLIGVSFATLDKLGVLMTTGQIPSDMGFAIQSNMIKEIFPYDNKILPRSVKFDKSTLYEKMLPSIALIAVSN